MTYDTVASVRYGNELTVNDPTAGKYYVGVLGRSSFGAAEFIVTAFVLNSCPNHCSGHGKCNAPSPSNTTCVCDPDWDYNSIDCSVFMGQLPSNGSVLSGEVLPGQWRFYSLYVPSDINHIRFNANLTSPENSTAIAL